MRAKYVLVVLVSGEPQATGHWLGFSLWFFIYDFAKVQFQLHVYYFLTVVDYIDYARNHVAHFLRQF